MLLTKSTKPLIQNQYTSPSPIIQFAEEELVRYWEKIFSNEHSPSSSEVTVVFSSDYPDSLNFDGYSIDIMEDTIKISSHLPRGILYGVYELLKLMGCRFLFPKKELEIIPSLSSIELKEETIIKNPWMEFRGLCLYNTTQDTLPETLDMIDYMAKNNYNLLMTSIHRIDDSVENSHAILWSEIGHHIAPELKKRGVVIDMSEHSTDYFFPREKWFKLHPEWFSMIDGVRSPLQICYSNEDAVKEYAKSFVDFAKEDNSFEILGIWPLDGGGYCECEDCKDPLTLLRANKYIAGEIKKVRPDLIVEHLAYTPQSFARPKENIPDNMSVLVCDVNDIVAYEWGLKAKNSGGAFYFDYHTADNYRFRANLWLNPFYCREMINTFIAYGYRGIVSLYLPITSWWQSSINYYYLAKAYYDPTLDIEEATRDLAIDLFGEKNSSVMTEILMKIYCELQDSTFWSRTPHKHAYFSEHITRRNRELDKIHLEKIKAVYQELQSLFGKVQVDRLNDFQHTQLSYLKEYVKLQNIYYSCIDQYSWEEDSPEKALPYFEALNRLEKQYGKVFISEAYARWRIIGRDNIFEPKNANEYQPQTK